MARLGPTLSAAVFAAAIATAGAVVAQNDPVGEVLRKAEQPKPEEPKAQPRATNAPAGNSPASVNAPAKAVNAPAATGSATKASPSTNAPARPASPPIAQTDEAKAPPDRRPRFPVAILEALDKVTAQTMRFEAPVGQPVRFRNLVFTVRSCETTTADEPTRDAAAYVEIDAQNPNPSRAAPGSRQVFKGWMFANSPSVNPLQHPVYDAWLIACKA